MFLACCFGPTFHLAGLNFSLIFHPVLIVASFGLFKKMTRVILEGDFPLNLLNDFGRPSTETKRCVGAGWETGVSSVNVAT